jgi:hypothetical protein
VRNSLHCAAGESTLLEVAGGHGLLGVLCAVFERRFARVVVTDRRRPPSFTQVLKAATEVAPWVAERVTYIETEFEGAGLLPAGSAVVCVHGCKSLTDIILQAAIEARVESMACMPCCYGHSAAAERAPPALRRSLGVALAADIERTYLLEGAGYGVHWRYIPSAITPMNRILTARRSGRSKCTPVVAMADVEGASSSSCEPCHR